MTKYLLDQHSYTHDNKKPYKCDQCGKAFLQNARLIAHTHMPTDRKQYSCEVCGKIFSKENNLFAHQRIHTGEKPFHLGGTPL